MLKILVTGDNHIGLKYANHTKKEEIIAARLNSLSRLVQKANEEQCGLLAVTGDLFDGVNVSKKNVEAVVKILSEFNETVAVLPGNHDYYDGNGKVWKYFEDASASCDKIALLKKSAPYEFAAGEHDVVIYPAFCGSLHSNPGENNLDWIKNTVIDDDGKYHIGMAHGAVEGESLDKEGAYFQMNRKELYDIPVDVWLIGHTHVPFPSDLSESFSATNERIFNAGTHSQTNVSNNTEGLCFILEIDQNKKIKAKKFKSGDLNFFRREIPVKDGLEKDLKQQLKDIPDNSVVDITFCGSVSEDEYKNKKQIIEKAGERFLEFDYNDSGLTRQITKGLIEKEFPETSVSAKLLLNLLENPKRAQMAYELLQSIKENTK